MPAPVFAVPPLLSARVDLWTPSSAQAVISNGFVFPREDGILNVVMNDPPVDSIYYSLVIFFSSGHGRHDSPRSRNSRQCVILSILQIRARRSAAAAAFPPFVLFVSSPDASETARCRYRRGEMQPSQVTFQERDGQRNVG